MKAKNILKLLKPPKIDRETIKDVADSHYQYKLKKNVSYEELQEEERKNEEMKHKHKMQTLCIWLAFFIILSIISIVCESMGLLSK